MPRNGSGSYSLPAGNPVVTGTTITSTWANNTLSDISTAITGSIAADGQTPISANLPMSGYKHTNVAAASATTDYARYDQVQNSAAQWLTSVSGTDTITASASPTPAAYAAGQTFRFTSAGANTGAATLNISGLGAKAITKNGTVALSAGDIPSGSVVVVTYDGTQFQVISVSGLIVNSGFSMNTAKLLGRSTASVGAIEEISIGSGISLTSGVLSSSSVQIQPVSASVAGNALTISASALSLDFRSTTLGSGTVTYVSGTPSNLVISSGSTLGTVNGVLSRIMVLAMNNAGTIELAAVNQSGGVNLDETTLISTTAEGGSGGADSASTIYSTTARSNLAFRVIGFIESTQATAGTWATSPSLIQGIGGQATATGFRTWQSVGGSRSSGTTYYNTTGRDIQVKAGFNTSYNPVAVVNGITVVPSLTSNYVADFTVPPGGSYSVTSGGITNWYELR